jgi:hypothetical protein
VITIWQKCFFLLHRKAEEYGRLSQVKCMALNKVTPTSEAVICLDLAASYMKMPLDKVSIFPIAISPPPLHHNDFILIDENK